MGGAGKQGAAGGGQGAGSPITCSLPAAHTLLILADLPRRLAPFDKVSSHTPARFLDLAALSVLPPSQSCSLPSFKSA